MSEENENKEASKEATQGSNKKYVALALVVILAAVGIMMNNNTEQTSTETSTIASAGSTPVADEPAIARIDITTPLVNADEPQFEVYVDGSEEPEKQARWMNRFGTQGYVIQNDNNKINIDINILNDAEVTILFKGPWDKDADGNMVEHWVDYTSIMVNDEEILSEPVAVWHNKSFSYTANTKSGAKIKIRAKWKKHSEI